MLLTIGQLAEHCGVTVRAIRHYHRVGLLPEAERDASGYRRYGAAAVIQLIRIKVLAEAGLPLIRIQQLIEASPAKFAAEVDGIDQALERQIAQLQHRRRQLAGLVAGDRLVLPAAVAELLDELRSMGASDRVVGLERDGWILMEVVAPELVAEWVNQKRAALADPELRSLYLAVDEAWAFEPDDPRLERLADRMAAWMTDHQRGDASYASPSLQSSMALVAQLIDAEMSSLPAVQRLGVLSRSKLDTTARSAATRAGDRDRDPGC